MDVKIYRNGSEITEDIISYSREQTLCDGVGTFSFTAVGSSTEDFTPWDTMLLYEDNIKKGTYYISEVSIDNPSYKISVTCQDGTKRLTDYFITDSYFIDYATHTRYWIEKFLVEAGVSYNFNVSDSGPLLSNNTTLGMDMAIGVITTLLKQSGWYMYFNANGIAVIGNATVNLNPTSLSLTDNDILSIEFNSNDKSARNRVVVWGGSGGSFSPYITAEVSAETPWQIDSGDKRTIVYTHSGIGSYATANEMAMLILDEFKDITPTKVIEFEGVRNISLAEAVRISNRDVYNGVGIVTSISSQMTSNGLTTTIILDEKCPRMFGYFRWGDEYVYAATRKNGVHRKPLASTVWEDYSLGLSSLEIKDLKVNNGLLVCVDFEGKAYRRLVEDFIWQELELVEVDDQNGTPYSADSLVAKACTISRGSNEIYLAVIPYSIEYTDSIAWVIKYDSSGEYLGYFQAVVDDGELFYFQDIDTDDRVLYLTITKSVGWLIPTEEYNSCGLYGFTTNGETEPTRTWTGNQGKTWSEVIFCNGVCYAIRVDYNDNDYLNVFRWDYSDPNSLDTFTSADYQYCTGASCWQDASLNIGSLYYNPDEDYLYFVIEDNQGDGTSDIYVKYYDFDTETFNTYTTYNISNADFPSTFRGTKQFTIYGEVISSPPVNYAWYIKVFDYLTGTWSSEEEILVMVLKEDNAGSIDIDTGNVIESIDMISHTYVVKTVKEGNPPNDDQFHGEGSYDEDWIPDVYVVWINISKEDYSITSSGNLKISPNSSFNSSDADATTHSTVNRYMLFGGRTSYYGLGPFVVMQLDITDNGPWIYTGDPLSGPYELQGHRDGENPTGYDENSYGTQVVINLRSSNYYFENNLLPISAGYDGDGADFTSSVHYTVKTSLSQEDVLIHLSDLQTPITSPAILGGNLLQFIDTRTEDFYSFGVGYTYARLYSADLNTYAKNWEAQFTTGSYPTNYISSCSVDLEGNIAVARVRKVPSTTPSYSELHFMEFSTYAEITAPIFITAKEITVEDDGDDNEVEGYTQRDFTVIDTTTQPHLLEMSQNNFVTTFSYSGSNRDTIRYAGVAGLNFNSLMPDKIVGNWPDPGIAENVWDIRVSKGIPSGVGYNPSGIYNLYAAFGQYLEMAPIVSGGNWTNIAVASGDPSANLSVYNLEITNKEYPPSIFYNLVTASGITASGLPASGVTVNTFYQKLSGQSAFINASVGIPGSKITVIRVDDRL